jgi:hypothetical protein
MKKRRESKEREKENLKMKRLGEAAVFHLPIESYYYLGFN